MAKQTVNLGTSANKGDGDPLRTAFTKVNANFTEVYSLLGAEGGDVDDVVAPMLVHNSHTNVTVTRDDAANKIIFSVDPYDGDITGSVFGDDSTVLVDGVNNTIPKANIEDSANWDTAFGWGNHTAGGYAPQTTTYTKTEVDSAISAVNTLDGDITGSVFADDSTLLVDGVGGKVLLTTNTTTELTEGTNLYYTDVRADARITNAGSANWNTAFGWGNHASAGYQVAGAPHDGDITGSVFGDDSTVLVDGINNKIVGAVDTASLTVSSTNVAIGYNAGTDVGGLAQGAGSIAIGYNAGNSSQNIESVAIGVNAGKTSQGEQSVAIGAYTAITSQGNSAVAIGDRAGVTSQGTNAVAIGRLAGNVEQSIECIAIGKDAGSGASVTATYVSGGVASTVMVVDDTTNIVVGMRVTSTGTGFTYTLLEQQQTVLSIDNATTVTLSAVANAGTPSGTITFKSAQDYYAVAIGSGAGQTSQGAGCVAIGYLAGKVNQDQGTAIGSRAGEITQGLGAVAVGVDTGRTNQGTHCVAVGKWAGYATQGQEGIAIGYQAGQTSQGEDSIAIGKEAGKTNQAARSIILNATNSALDTTQTDSLIIKPIRSAAMTTILGYDAGTGEVTHNAAIPGYISLADLKTEVAASADFAAFKGRIAAL